MRIFVTGATGFVGSAVVDELLASGHKVLGLVRSAAKTDALKRKGVDVLLGDLSDLALLAEGARECDAVIHTAFNHDFSRFAENCETDARAIEAMGQALEGTTRPLVATAGVGMLASQGELATEQDAPIPPSAAYPRRSEAAVAALAARGIHASVVRLPPSVHGPGDHGFVPQLVRVARETGVSAYIHGGLNRWSAVHRMDAARMFRLAVEANTIDARFHAVADEGIALRDIATLIGRRLGVPVMDVTHDEARKHFGWFADFAGIDAPASSVWTRHRLGWSSEQPGLLDDLENAGYFDD